MHHAPLIKLQELFIVVCVCVWHIHTTIPVLFHCSLNAAGRSCLSTPDLVNAASLRCDVSHPEHMAVLIGSFCISNRTNSPGTEARALGG